MSASQFKRCADACPELKTFLLRSIGLKLHLVLERLDELVRLPTYIRLAKILRDHADVSGKVRLRQKDLAELLGVSVLSCHKAVHKLCKLDLISAAYGAIVIQHPASFNDWLAKHLSLGKL